VGAGFDSNNKINDLTVVMLRANITQDSETSNGGIQSKLKHGCCMAFLLSNMHLHCCFISLNYLHISLNNSQLFMRCLPSAFLFYDYN